MSWQAPWRHVLRSVRLRVSCMLHAHVLLCIAALLLLRSNVSSNVSLTVPAGCSGVAHDLGPVPCPSWFRSTVWRAGNVDAQQCAPIAICDASSALLQPACAHAGSAARPGTVLSFAKDANRLSLGRAHGKAGLPAPVDGGPANIAYVSAGGHNAVVDADGRLWTWGRNNSAGGGGYGSAAIDSSGQLAAGRAASAAVSVAAPVSSAARVVAVDSGRYHTAALTSDGQLVTWGLNDFAQLGRSAQNSSGSACDNGADCHDGQLQLAESAEQAFAGEHLVAVAAGRYHTVVAARSGAVYTSGLNLCGNSKV